MTIAWNRIRNGAGWSLVAAGALGMTGTVHAQGSPYLPVGHPQVVPQQVTAWTTSPQPDSLSRLAIMNVELAWLANAPTFPYRLEARPAGDALQIQGYVPTETIHELAVKLAREQSGLRILDAVQVAPNLAAPTVSKPASALGRDAVATIQQALPLQARNIQVSVWEHGQVRLKGAVQNYEDKLTASRCLRQVAGCSCVINQLTVQALDIQAKATPTKTDEPKTDFAFPAGPTITAAVAQTTPKPIEAQPIQPISHMEQVGSTVTVIEPASPTPTVSATVPAVAAVQVKALMQNRVPLVRPSAAPEPQLTQNQDSVRPVQSAASDVAKPAALVQTSVPQLQAPAAPQAPAAQPYKPFSYYPTRWRRLEAVQPRVAAASVNAAAPSAPNLGAAPTPAVSETAPAPRSAPPSRTSATVSAAATAPVLAKSAAAVPSPVPAVVTVSVPPVPVAVTKKAVAKPEPTPAAVQRAEGMPGIVMIEEPAAILTPSQFASVPAKAADAIALPAAVKPSPKPMAPVKTDAYVLPNAVANNDKPAPQLGCYTRVVIDSAPPKVEPAVMPVASWKVETKGEEKPVPVPTANAPKLLPLPVRSEGSVTSGVIVFEEVETVVPSRVKPQVVSKQNGLRQAIARACGKATHEVDVSFTSESELLVRVKAHTAQEAEALSLKVFQMDELEPYKVSLDISLAP